MRRCILITALLLSSIGLFAQPTSAVGVLNNLIPLVAIITTMAVPVLIVVFIHYFRHKDHKARMAVAQAAIEAGLTIPEDLFKTVEKKKKTHLQNALECIAAGIGVGAMLWIIVEPKFAIIGLFIFLMGIAYLILHFIEKKQLDRKTNEEKEN